MAQKNIIMVHKNIKTVAVITLITSVMWTALSIYSALTKAPNVDVKPEMLAPVDASFDQDTLDTLTRKRQISEETLPDDFVPTHVEKLQAGRPVVPSAKPTPTTSILPEQAQTP